MLHIQRIGKHQRLGSLDPFAVVEIPRHLDEVERIPRVLADPRVHVRVGSMGMFRAFIDQGGCDGSVG